MSEEKINFTVKPCGFGHIIVTEENKNGEEGKLISLPKSTDFAGFIKKRVTQRIKDKLSPEDPIAFFSEGISVDLPEVFYCNALAKESKESKESKDQIILFLWCPEFFSDIIVSLVQSESLEKENGLVLKAQACGSLAVEKEGQMRHWFIILEKENVNELTGGQNFEKIFEKLYAEQNPSRGAQLRGGAAIALIFLSAACGTALLVAHPFLAPLAFGLLAAACVSTAISVPFLMCWRDRNAKSYNGATFYEEREKGNANVINGAEGANATPGLNNKGCSA